MKYYVKMDYIEAMKEELAELNKKGGQDKYKELLARKIERAESREQYAREISDGVLTFAEVQAWYS